MESFVMKDLVRAVEETSALMDANKQRLIDMDAVIGDADLGLTMTKGFAVAVQCARELTETDLGTGMKKIGFAIAKAVPSTMGTLMATAFMGAGKAFAGREELGAADIATLFQTMAQSIQDRGKAKEGEKTLLDVLFPVARAVQADESKDVTGRMAAAHTAALAALEATKELMSQHGKAAVFREKTLGLEDPGGAAATLLVEGFARACGAV